MLQTISRNNVQSIYYFERTSQIRKLNTILFKQHNTPKYITS